MRKLFLTLALLVMTLAVQAQETVVEIPGSRGQLKTLVVRPKQLAEGEKCPLVVIMHGFTGNKNEPLLKGLSESLLKENIASVRFDFNGHGESEGEFQYMTIRNEIEDAKAVIRYMQSLPWVGKLSVAGHSQGGVIASMVAGELNEAEVTSVVLYAPAANIGDGCRNGNMLGKRFDPNNVPEIFEVWGKKLRRHYIDIARTMPMYETAALFRGPACVIHGEKDNVVPKACGEKYAAGYKNAELHIQPADDHGFNKNRPGAIKIGADFLIKTLKGAK